MKTFLARLAAFGGASLVVLALTTGTASAQNSSAVVSLGKLGRVEASCSCPGPNGAGATRPVVMAMPSAPAIGAGGR